MHLSSWRQIAKAIVRVALRAAPLWLVLVAFTGQATFPPLVLGTLVPRTAEEETDSPKEVWKCIAGDLRGQAGSRAMRRSAIEWARPAQCVQSIRQLVRTITEAPRATSCELDDRNGWGGPLRC
jgi:hypothetical protein